MSVIIIWFFYVIIPIIGVYLAYRYLIKKHHGEKFIAIYDANKDSRYPKSLKAQSLPEDVEALLDRLYEKGEKLRSLYTEDTDHHTSGTVLQNHLSIETTIMIDNLLNKHVPEAVLEYQKMVSNQGHNVDKLMIKHSKTTGKQALIDILQTINEQFDDLLMAIYHEDGQKLLAIQGYLQNRFN